MKKTKLLIFVLLMTLSATIVQASLLDGLQNTAEGITNIVSVTFDYIVRFIQWIFITSLNVYFFIVFLLFYLVLFLALYIPVKIEPYFTQIQRLGRKLMLWFKGKGKV